MTSTLISKSLLCAATILVALTFTAVSGQIPQQKDTEPIESETLADKKPEASAKQSPVAGNSTSAQLAKWISRNSANGVVTAKPDNSRLTSTGPRPSSLGVAPAAAPTQQPVSLTTDVVFVLAGDFEVDGVAPYTVPQGKQLVIQHLAAKVANDNSIPRCSAYVVVDANSANPLVLPIVLTQQGSYPPGPGPGSGSSFGGSQQVTIYLHAGQILQFGGSRADVNDQSQFSWFLYGYLVPAP